MQTIRRFEYYVGKTPKWWNIVLDGRKCITFTASIGSSPKRHEKSHRDAERAAVEFEKEFKKKISAGYVEVDQTGSSRGKLNCVWARIEDWFRLHSPSFRPFPLATGVSGEQIATVEQKLGFQLPSDFANSYQRHDGSNTCAIFEIFGLGYWMPLLVRPRRWIHSVYNEWDSMTSMLDSGAFDDPGFISSPTGPIRTDHWNRKWVPFTCSDTGDFLAIDLSPAKGGQRGQVIFWWHEVGAVTVVASSFLSLLSQLADHLEAGTYEFNDSGSLCARGNQALIWDELLQIFRG